MDVLQATESGKRLFEARWSIANHMLPGQSAQCYKNGF